MATENSVEKKRLLNEIAYLSKLINEHKKTSRKPVFNAKSTRLRSVVKTKRVSPYYKPNTGTKRNMGVYISPAQRDVSVIALQTTQRDKTAALHTRVKNSTETNALRTVAFRSPVRIVASSSKLSTVLKSTASFPAKRTVKAVTHTLLNTAKDNSVSSSVTSTCRNPYHFVKEVKHDAVLRSNSTLTNAEALEELRLVSVSRGDNLTVKIHNELNSPKMQSNILESSSVPIAKSLSTSRTRVVCSPTVKQQPQRVVLKSSQYKWNATNQPVAASKVKARSVVQSINALSHKKQSAKAEVKNPPSSVYRLVRNTASRTPPINRSKKVVKTKYKLIRKEDYPEGTPAIRTKYKLVKKGVKISPFRFMRKVGKYSIKYVEVNKNKSSRFPYGSKTRKSKSPFLLRKRSVHQYVRHRLIRRLSKEFKTVSTPLTSKLVMIGGILYKSSPNQLSRTDKKSNNKIKITTLTDKKPRIVIVRGVKFMMDATGKTLRRLEESTPPTTAKDMKTPLSTRRVSRVDLGGKTYIQAEPGVLVQSQSAHKRSLASQAVNRSINRLATARKKSSQYCMFFNRFGKCSKKEDGKCPYIHDPEKIAVCTRFLKGNCTIENCPFSHKICRSKMPACSFFLRGRCNSDNCPYLHVNVNRDAETCQDFLKGYCPLGSKCKKHHRFSCPEFQRTGKCDKGDKCPLKHIKHKPKQKPVEEKINVESKTSCEETAQLQLTDFSEDKKDDHPNHRRLPSFIKLSDDDSEAESEITPSESKPLRIKPQFLCKK